jgi:hypothetical protein
MLSYNLLNRLKYTTILTEMQKQAASQFDDAAIQNKPVIKNK